jgi:hypothetical protein
LVPCDSLPRFTSFIGDTLSLIEETFFLLFENYFKLLVKDSIDYEYCFFCCTGKTGTNLLQKVYVPIINNRVCYAWHELKDIILELHDEMFCAGHEQGKMDACLVSQMTKNISIQTYNKTKAIN